MRALGGEVLDYLKQMADGTGQTIETHDDERVAGAYLTQELQ